MRAPLLAALALGCLGASCARRAALPMRAVSLELRLPRVSAADLPPGGLEGKVLLVNFFATWCFPCISELPTFQALHRRYGGAGLAVLGVGMDLEGARVLEPFAEFHALAYPVVVADERIRRGESAFGRISALPTTFLVGRDGVVLAAYEGTGAPEGLESLVKGALAP